MVRPTLNKQISKNKMNVTLTYISVQSVILNTMIIHWMKSFINTSFLPEGKVIVSLHSTADKGKRGCPWWSLILLSEHTHPGCGRREGQTESVFRMPSSLQPPGVRSALHGGSADAGCAHPQGSRPGLLSYNPPWWAGAGAGAVPFQFPPGAEQLFRDAEEPVSVCFQCQPLLLSSSGRGCILCNKYLLGRSFN